MKQGQCGMTVSEADLSPNDLAEVTKFKRYLEVEASRRNGADSNACDLLQAAIYYDSEKEGGGL